jgi:hypothetical protein
MTHAQVTALTQFVDANGNPFRLPVVRKRSWSTAAFHAVTMKTEWIFWSGSGLKAPVFLVIF